MTSQVQNMSTNLQIMDLFNLANQKRVDVILNIGWSQGGPASSSLTYLSWVSKHISMLTFEL